MNKKTKKKLCWNCEGNAAFEDENCPYCGVYLNPLSIGGSEEQENHLFSPPYRIPEEEEQEVPASPFAIANDEDGAASSKQVFLDDLMQNKADEMKAVILPLVLLLSGSMFFLFGLALVLFSNKGTFTLSWDANYWFLYFIMSAPFLFFGWKFLESVQHPKS